MLIGGIAATKGIKLPGMPGSHVMHPSEWRGQISADSAKRFRIISLGELVPNCEQSVIGLTGVGLGHDGQYGFRRRQGVWPHGSEELPYYKVVLCWLACTPSNANYSCSIIYLQSLQIIVVLFYLKLK